MDRKQMEDVINGGGSVLHEGKLITKIENLPSKAALAKTDEEKELSAKELKDQIAALQKQHDALTNPKGGKSAKGGEVEKETETPESLMKLGKEELVKRAEEVAKAAKTEFDPNATKQVLVKFILSGGEVEKETE